MVIVSAALHLCRDGGGGGGGTLHIIKPRKSITQSVFYNQRLAPSQGGH